MSSITTAGVHKCELVCVKVCGCLRVCAWDEFSEYLLENRVPTSADFNTYSICIFKVDVAIQKTETNTKRISGIIQANVYWPTRKYY